MSANAADCYRQALSLLPAESAEVTSCLDAARGVITGRLRAAELELVRRGQLAVESLRQGSALPTCSWALTTAEELKELVDSPMHALADIACLQARQELQEKRGERAYELIADLMVFGHRVGQVGPLRGRLVHLGLVGKATDLAAGHLLRQRPSVLDDFARRLDNLPDSGNLLYSMRCEQRWLADVFRHQLEGKSQHTVRELMRGWLVDDDLISAILHGSTPLPAQLDFMESRCEQLGHMSILPRAEFLKTLLRFCQQYQSDYPAITLMAKSCDLINAAVLIWEVRCKMLRAAISIASRPCRSCAADDADCSSFEYRPVPGGFELRFTVGPENRPFGLFVALEPIVLRVGDGLPTASFRTFLRRLFQK